MQTKKTHQYLMSSLPPKKGGENNNDNVRCITKVVQPVSGCDEDEGGVQSKTKLQGGGMRRGKRGQSKETR